MISLTTHEQSCLVVEYNWEVMVTIANDVKVDPNCQGTLRDAY